MQYKVLNYRKRFFFLISTVLSVLLLTFSIEQALPVEVKNTDPEKTRKELKSLNKKISKLQKAQNKNINRRDKTQKKLKETELEINSISKKAFKIEKQLNTSNKAISEYKLKFEQLNEQKTQQQGALIADIRSSYSSGKEEYLKLILSQKDPHTLSRHVRYYEYFQKARVKRIEGYNQTISELDEITASLEKEAELLESLRKRLNEQKSALKGAQKQRLTALSKLNKDISSQDHKIKQWQSSQKHLEKILETLNKALSDLPANIGSIAFPKRKGKMQWPTVGSIWKNFGSQRAQGRLKWNGVLIQAPPGQAVRAIHGGRVVFSDWIRSYGLLMIIDHGNGYFSLYGHNQSLYKETGDWVTAGEKIASIGNSGGLQGSGLYFEIRKGEIPVNPNRWCVARK